MIILRTVKNISSLNIMASILLFLTAILAAVIANSPMASLYQGFLLQELHLRIGDFNLFSHGGHPLKMIEFINDCLMTVFFLVLGKSSNSSQRRFYVRLEYRLRLWKHECGKRRYVLLQRQISQNRPHRVYYPR